MAQAAASTCEICTGGPGEHYCQQCDQLFCGNCKLSHLRAKSCKNHTFVSGRDINQEEKLLCTDHKESFLFYCQDCDTPVCRICSVEKHSRHLMTDLTKSTKKLRSELVKDIELKETTSRQNVNTIEKYTKAYREEVKAVIKTITEEGNYWKKLIDKKVEGFVKLVQDEEQKALHNMSALIKVHRKDFENCQQWQKNIKEMESIADVLLLKKLKKLKVDVDNIELQQVPERSSVSYRNKKPLGTEIDSLFGELQFKEGKALMAKTENQQNTRSKESQKIYKYACGSLWVFLTSVTHSLPRKLVLNKGKCAFIFNVYTNIDRSAGCSSSECERGFRQMKSVKTTFRSSLNEESLASQMTIRLHSPPIEKFDPKPAILLWNSGVIRRPNFKDVAQQDKIKEATVNVTKETTAAINEHLAEVHEPILTEDIEPEPQHIILGCEDSDYSDDEEYSTESGVFRAMCREGLIEE
ncbi:unnamed protein product [Mytilus edulis]|uniref:B box-type domain-containing protein n=1 Tax=Mytilus edulis TaxID=6550 RepID=A0A8S3TJQ6_MYTED|nr:unnamed protein product [Mytilus edulis]